MKLLLLLTTLLPLAAHPAHAADDEPASAGAGLANPASQYCVSVGGELEIRTEASGEVGYCHLPDGRVVEEWTLFRAEGQ